LNAAKCEPISSACQTCEERTRRMSPEEEFIAWFDGLPQSPAVTRVVSSCGGDKVAATAQLVGHTNRQKFHELLEKWGAPVMLEVGVVRFPMNFRPQLVAKARSLLMGEGYEVDADGKVFKLSP
jgi:hypothetical protein